MKMSRILTIIAVVLVLMLTFTSCEYVQGLIPGLTPEHQHSFVEGKCECGETDPDYVAPQPEHTHSFVEGKCECGESDPDYKEPTTDHTHSFVEGKCECGATDPNYVVVPLSNATLDCTTKDNRVSFSSEQQVWSQNGITLTLNRGEGTAYSDKAPVQFASKGSLTIEGTGIKTIVIETGNTTYGTYVSNCFNGQPGVASVSAKTGIVTIVLTEAVDVFTIEYLAKQGQIKSITVNPES